MIVSRLIRFLIFVLFTVAPWDLSAATTKVVLTAERLLDVKSGQLISPGVLVVEGSRIIEINPDTLPDGVEVLALGDATLLKKGPDTFNKTQKEYG
jgi:hypothetical protein